MLAAAAILVAARRFGERHTDQVAVMKSLGATRATIRQLYAFSLAWLGLISIGLGSGIGWLAQSACLMRLRATSERDHPYWYCAVHHGRRHRLCLYWVFCMATAGALGWCIATQSNSPRRDHCGRHSSTDLILGTASLGLLMLWYSSDWKLTGALIGSIAITVGLGFFVARRY